MTEYEALSRDEAKRQLAELGAIIGGSVTKDTDVLILGTDPGRVKLERAKLLGIPIIPWPMFVALGFTEKRTDPHSALDQDLLTVIAIQMGVIANAIFAHLSTSKRNTKRSVQLWAAFACAYHGVDFFLRAAWGEPVGLEGTAEGRGQASGHSLNPGACLQCSRHAWEGAAVYLARASTFTE